MRQNIEGIQYLRGIAACMVASHHAMSYFGRDDVPWEAIFGARRVDLFIVISGFIMAYTTRHFDPEGQRLAQAWQFFVRRFWRIVPLYWIALAVACRSFLWTDQGHAGVLLDFLFIPRFHPTEGQVWPWLVPGWTLNYEMFFYVAFAASMLFGRWRKVALACTLVALVCAGLLLQPTSAPGQFYTATLLLEFALGMGVYALRDKVTHRGALWALLAIGTTILLLDEAPDALRGFTAGPAAAAVVLSVARLCQGVSIPPLLALGNAAYCIYLFHTTSFALTARIADAIGIERVPTLGNLIASQLVLVGGAAFIGLVLHRWLEQPLLRYTRRFVPEVQATPTPQLQWSAGVLQQLYVGARREWRDVPTVDANAGAAPQ